MSYKEIEFENPSITMDEETHTYYYDGEEMQSCSGFYNTFFKDFDMSVSKWSALAVNKEIHAYGVEDAGELDPSKFPKSIKLFGEDNWEEEVMARMGKATPVTPRRVELIWEAKGVEAADEGTLVHEEIEKCIQGVLNHLEDEVDPRTVAAMAGLGNIRNINGVDHVDIKTELMVGSKELGVCGTIDCLLVYDDHVVIVDWKTNKSLSDKSKYGDKALEPISHLEDCSITKYSLQQTIYAYLLKESKGVDTKRTYLVHVPAFGGYDVIPLELLFDELDDMIATGKGR